MSETIRIATIADAEAVTALTCSAYTKWVPLIGRAPLPMKADHSAHIRDHRADLLFVGDQMAALVETIQHSDHLLIENLAVAPAFQGRGHGKRMVAHAEKIAVAFGLRIVRLYTNAKFEENLRLYASLGYRIEREETMGESVIIHMTKEVM